MDKNIDVSPEMAAAISKREMSEAISNRVDINNAFTIIPKKDGDLILAEIKTSKETGNQYYPTLAVYQVKFSLATEFIHRCVKRAAWVKEITSASALRDEYKLASDLVFAAIAKLQHQGVNHG
ncbi:DUF5405 family protein [Rahnella aceris]|jgi:hypothetical protein|uniref:DUF5405 family protein n=1 Tax=Rahnella sp. (strain Y9602) TaxID=2703885 RepID=UPI001904CC73|nr:DUF5405 family protein [Rahnella aceris]QQN34564.1 DUF5405 family protein [Rahnella aceris]